MFFPILAVTASMAAFRRSATTFSPFSLRSLFQQTARLVNQPPKWTKDRHLDHVVSREKHLRQVLHLISTLTISSSSYPPKLPPQSLLVLHLYPSFFHLHSQTLTPLALRLHHEEQHVVRQSIPDVIDRLRKLLMLTISRSLPLHSVDLLQFDLGLPFDYKTSILPHYPQFFRVYNVPDDERVFLGLVSWDDRLAVPEMWREDRDNREFQVRFTKGFGMKKRWMEWLAEWQRLPYISPYDDPSGIDPRTDVSEKRNVGVFHELLHLTIGKKTDRRNVSNLRKALSLPQKFTKVFERHPGIFYISKKLDSQTVVLREAYGGGRELLRKHPLVEVREKFIAVLRTGRVEDNDFSCSESEEEEDAKVDIEYVSPAEESDCECVHGS